MIPVGRGGPSSVEAEFSAGCRWLTPAGAGERHPDATGLRLGGRFNLKSLRDQNLPFMPNVMVVKLMIVVRIRSGTPV